MDQYQLPQDIVNARTVASQAAQNANDLAGGSYTIKDQLEKAINSAVDYNRPLVEAKNTALAGYLSAPAEAGMRYSAKTLQNGEINPNYIFDPFAARAIGQRDINTALVPFLTNSDILGYARGAAGTGVEKGVNAYSGLVNTAQNNAQLSRQNYQDLLTEYMQNRTFKEQVDQFNKTLAENQRQFNLTPHGGSGSGTSLADEIALLKEAMGTGQSDTSFSEEDLKALEAQKQAEREQALNDSIKVYQQNHIIGPMPNQTPSLGQVPSSVTGNFGLNSGRNDALSQSYLGY